MIRDYSHAAYLQERHDRTYSDEAPAERGFVMEIDEATGLDMRIVKARAARAKEGTAA
jgi:hypothetical protein